VDLDGPGDGVAYNKDNGKVYVDEDDGTHIWIFDGATMKLEGSVEIKGAPEWIQYDGDTHMIYQNIKKPNILQVVDPATSKVVKEYVQEGVEGPHGLAIDEATGKLFSGGKNGKLAQIDAATGKIDCIVDIAKGVDQVSYDEKLKRIYCACGSEISVVQYADGMLKSLGSIAAPKGAHTVAIDSKSHDVWVSYADADHSYLKSFTVTDLK
jgi:DNA-binding beta-propeller fold protein YncE